MVFGEAVVDPPAEIWQGRSVDTIKQWWLSKALLPAPETAWWTPEVGLSQHTASFCTQMAL